MSLTYAETGRPTGHGDEQPPARERGREAGAIPGPAYPATGVRLNYAHAKHACMQADAELRPALRAAEAVGEACGRRRGGTSPRPGMRRAFESDAAAEGAGAAAGSTISAFIAL